jgi:transcriptional regulator with XRE-family HTH domain
MRIMVQKRKQAGLSQRALAAELGYSENCVAEWEIGATRPAYQSLVDWLSYFNLQLSAEEIQHER